MITFHHEVLDCYGHDSRFQTLISEFKRLLAPQLSLKDIEDFYLKNTPVHADAIFIYKDQARVGFASVAFYHSPVQGKEVVIARVAVAVDASARGGALPLELILDILADYKKGIGDTPLYFVGFLANALVYNAICEHVHDVYPRKGVEVPADVEMLREKLAAQSALAVHEASPFAIKLPFQVKIEKELGVLINKSTRPNIQHFRLLNPDFMAQYVLMVICPMTWDNIKRSRQIIADKKFIRQ